MNYLKQLSEKLGSPKGKKKPPQLLESFVEENHSVAKTSSIHDNEGNHGPGVTSNISYHLSDTGKRGVETMNELELFHELTKSGNQIDVGLALQLGFRCIETVANSAIIDQKLLRIGLIFVEWSLDKHPQKLTITQQILLGRYHKMFYILSNSHTTDIYHISRSKDWFESCIKTAKEASQEMLNMKPAEGGKFMAIEDIKDPSEEVTSEVWLDYIKSLLFLGELEKASSVMLGVLSNFDTAENYATLLFFMAVIQKAMKRYDQASNYFFEATQAGPPRYFNKLEMMTIISRNIEESTSDVSSDIKNDAYEMVYTHMVLEGYIPESLEYDDWINSAATWRNLADKCVLHEAFPLAADLYAQGIKRDFVAFNRAKLWFAFAKSCFKCGRNSDAILSLKQALTMDPFNMQLIRTLKSWSGSPPTPSSVFVAGDFSAIKDLFNNEVRRELLKMDPSEKALLKVQAIVRGMMKRVELSYEFQGSLSFGEDRTMEEGSPGATLKLETIPSTEFQPREHLHKFHRLFARCGMQLISGEYVLLSVKADFMGRIRSITVFEPHHDLHAHLKLRQVFAPIKQLGKPRRLSLTMTPGKVRRYNKKARNMTTNVAGKAISLPSPLPLPHNSTTSKSSTRSSFEFLSEDVEMDALNQAKGNALLLKMDENNLSKSPKESGGDCDYEMRDVITLRFTDTVSGEYLERSILMVKFADLFNPFLIADKIHARENWPENNPLFDREPSVTLSESHPFPSYSPSTMSAASPPRTAPIPEELSTFQEQSSYSLASQGSTSVYPGEEMVLTDIVEVEVSRGGLSYSFVSEINGAPSQEYFLYHLTQDGFWTKIVFFHVSDNFQWQVLMPREHINRTSKLRGPLLCLWQLFHSVNLFQHLCFQPENPDLRKMIKNMKKKKKQKSSKLKKKVNNDDSSNNREDIEFLQDDFDTEYGWLMDTLQSSLHFPKVLRRHHVKVSLELYVLEDLFKTKCLKSRHDTITVVLRPEDTSQTSLFLFSDVWETLDPMSERDPKSPSRMRKSFLRQSMQLSLAPLFAEFQAQEGSNDDSLSGREEAADSVERDDSYQPMDSSEQVSDLPVVVVGIDDSAKSKSLYDEQFFLNGASFQNPSTSSHENPLETPVSLDEMLQNEGVEMINETDDGCIEITKKEEDVSKSALEGASPLIEMEMKNSSDHPSLVEQNTNSNIETTVVIANKERGDEGEDVEESEMSDVFICEEVDVFQRVESFQTLEGLRNDKIDIEMVISNSHMDNESMSDAASRGSCDDGPIFDDDDDYLNLRSSKDFSLSLDQVRSMMAQEVVDSILTLCVEGNREERARRLENIHHLHQDEKVLHSDSDSNSNSNNTIVSSLMKEQNGLVVARSMVENIINKSIEQLLLLSKSRTEFVAQSAPHPRLSLGDNHSDGLVPPSSCPVSNRSNSSTTGTDSQDIFSLDVLALDFVESAVCRGMQLATVDLLSSKGNKTRKSMEIQKKRSISAESDEFDEDSVGAPSLPTPPRLTSQKSYRVTILAEASKEKASRTAISFVKWQEMTFEAKEFLHACGNAALQHQELQFQAYSELLKVRLLAFEKMDAMEQEILQRLKEDQIREELRLQEESRRIREQEDQLRRELEAKRQREVEAQLQETSFMTREDDFMHIFLRELERYQLETIIDEENNGSMELELRRLGSSSDGLEGISPGRISPTPEKSTSNLSLEIIRDVDDHKDRSVSDLPFRLQQNEPLFYENLAEDYALEQLGLGKLKLGPIRASFQGSHHFHEALQQVLPMGNRRISFSSAHSQSPPSSPKVKRSLAHHSPDGDGNNKATIGALPGASENGNNGSGPTLHSSSSPSFGKKKNFSHRPQGSKKPLWASVGKNAPSFMNSSNSSYLSTSDNDFLVIDKDPLLLRPLDSPKKLRDLLFQSNSKTVTNCSQDDLLRSQEETKTSQSRSKKPWDLHEIPEEAYQSVEGLKKALRSLDPGALVRTHSHGSRGGIDGDEICDVRDYTYDYMLQSDPSLRISGPPSAPTSVNLNGRRTHGKGSGLPAAHETSMIEVSRSLDPGRKAKQSSSSKSARNRKKEASNLSNLSLQNPSEVLLSSSSMSSLPTATYDRSSSPPPANSKGNGNGNNGNGNNGNGNGNGNNGNGNGNGNGGVSSSSHNVPTSPIQSASKKPTSPLASTSLVNGSSPSIAHSPLRQPSPLRNKSPANGIGIGIGIGVGSNSNHLYLGSSSSSSSSSSLTSSSMAGQDALAFLSRDLDSRNQIFRSSLESFQSKGYGVGSACSYTTYWEARIYDCLNPDPMPDSHDSSVPVTSAMIYGRLKKAIAILQRNFPFPLERSEAFCAIADSHGNVLEALGKLKQPEYHREIQLVCSVLRVEAVIDWLEKEQKKSLSNRDVGVLSNNADESFSEELCSIKRSLTEIMEDNESTVSKSNLSRTTSLGSRTDTNSNTASAFITGDFNEFRDKIEHDFVFSREDAESINRNENAHRQERLKYVEKYANALPSLSENSNGSRPSSRAELKNLHLHYGHSVRGPLPSHTLAGLSTSNSSQSGLSSSKKLLHDAIARYSSHQSNDHSDIMSKSNTLEDSFRSSLPLESENEHIDSFHRSNLVSQAPREGSRFVSDPAANMSHVDGSNVTNSSTTNPMTPSLLQASEAGSRPRLHGAAARELLPHLNMSSQSPAVKRRASVIINPHQHQHHSPKTNSFSIATTLSSPNGSSDDYAVVGEPSVSSATSSAFLPPIGSGNGIKVGHINSSSTQPSSRPSSSRERWGGEAIGTVNEDKHQTGRSTGMRSSLDMSSKSRPTRMSMVGNSAGNASSSNTNTSNTKKVRMDQMIDAFYEESDLSNSLIVLSRREAMKALNEDILKRSDRYDSLKRKPSVSAKVV